MSVISFCNKTLSVPIGAETEATRVDSAGLGRSIELELVVGRNVTSSVGF